ncbi:MAG: OprO/OprP family phosphate-selective porin [Acidobacteria bacterium]|nr:OprO/OprP family phosphate-selective porin [Acidobacteriota bacterium]
MGSVEKILLIGLLAARTAAQTPAEPGAVAAPSPPVPAVAQQESPKLPPVRFLFRKPPSLRIGDEFRMDFRVRLQSDIRDFRPDLPIDGDTFVFRRARVGIQGRVYDDLEYEVDAELRDTDAPWRNVFLNYRRFRVAEVQGGRFKMPFGRDQLSGMFNINFLERSLIGSYLAPGRDEGAMVHGQFADGIVAYETGVFRSDGDNSHLEESPGAGRTWAGRVVVAPLARKRRRWRSLEVGAAATSGTLPEGLNSLTGRTLSGYRFVEPVYVRGRRVRLGLEGGWAPGPFSVQAEYTRVNDQRNGQGLGDVDLTDAVSQGWYLSGTWALTGERKAGGIEPRRPLFQGGIGAVELGARIEAMRFGSGVEGDEPPFANPRAANLLENRDRILTLGVNWYLNLFGRVSFNATREDIKDPARSPVLDRTRFWGAALRLQFVL